MKNIYRVIKNDFIANGSYQESKNFTNYKIYIQQFWSGGLMGFKNNLICTAPYLAW